MSTFEIVVQRKQTAGWPVVAEYQQPGDLPSRHEGLLTLDEVQLRAQVTARSYGQILGQTVFTQPLRDALTRALAQNSDALRILLYIEDEGLRQLRWERLAAPIDGEWLPLSLSQRTPFSLYLPSITDRSFPPIGRRDLRALIVAANPAGLDAYHLKSFEVAGAVTDVRASLGVIPHDVLADLPDASGPPTLDTLLARLTAQPYSLLHIICHGVYERDSGETVIFLAGEKGEVRPVRAAEILDRLRLLRGGRGLPYLIFLASCESAAPEAEGALGGLGQRLVRELGVPAVVAMTGRISVRTAQEMTSVFYLQLQKHGEPDRALAEACAGLVDRHDISVPALYSRLGGRALFTQAADRALTPAEIAYGLERLAALLPERAPVLQTEYARLSGAIGSGLDGDPAMLSHAARGERQEALAALDALCAEATDISFHGLALGQEPPSYDGRCPFPGLMAFQIEDRRFFFGRETEAAMLAALLAEGNFLAVVGPSGCGKSSLVMAGLVAILRQRQPDLQIAYCRPGDDPQAQLEAALRDTPRPPHLLVIDQFEELFTSTTNDDIRRAFLDRVLNQAQKHRVVVIMRGEFLDDCAIHPQFFAALQRRLALIGPMGQAELRSSIEQQAATVGLRFEADLVNTILDDVTGEPGAMPLLQHLLRRLWQERHGRWLRTESYRRLGGARQAMADVAESIYAALPASEQGKMRSLFFRLIRLDESDERRDTRSRALFDDLVHVESDRAGMIQIVNRLANERLLVTSPHPITGRQTVELAHEALITAWGRLRGWVNEDRRGLLVWQRLGRAALEWEQNGRLSGLVYQEPRLGEALAWQQMHPDQINSLEKAFLAASQREIVRQRRRLLALVAPLPVLLILLALAAALRIDLLAPRSGNWRHIDDWIRATGETGRYGVAAVIDSRQPQTVYAAGRTRGGLYRSDDAGVTWQRIGVDALADAVVRQLAPAADGSLYAVTSLGLMRSADRGETWQNLNVPISTDESPLWALAADSEQAQHLFLGVWHSGVWETRDGGATWSCIAGVAHRNDCLSEEEQSEDSATADEKIEASHLIRGLALAAGKLYVATDLGLFSLDPNVPGAAENVQIPIGASNAGLLSVASLPNGGLLLGTRGDGIWQREEGAWRPLNQPGDAASFAFSTSRQGDLTLAGTSDSGLWLRRQWHWWQPSWWRQHVETAASPFGSTSDAAMVSVLPGEFESGRAASARLLYLDRFDIDRLEVTRQDFCDFDAACKRTAEIDDATFPAVAVTGAQAQTFCEQTGRRLPTEVEWEKAARGPDGRLFPWGDSLPTDRRAAVRRGIPEFEASGQSQQYIEAMLVGNSQPVGSHPAGRSPYGAEDLTGNVWEITKFTGLKPEYVVRGGSLADDAWSGSAVYPPVRTQLPDFNTGFRCVRAFDSPSP